MHRLAVLAVLAVLAASIPAAAQGTFASATSGPWPDPATWALTAGADADGVPDADDAVTISAGHAVSATSGMYEAASLTVRVGGSVDGGPYWAQTLVVAGPVVNRGTLGRDLALRLGGTVTNEGTWIAPTTLTGAAHTLTAATGTTFDGALTVEAAGAVLVAGSDLVFAGDNYQARVEIGSARLEMGPHRLTLDGRWLYGTGGGRVVLAGDSVALADRSPAQGGGGRLYQLTVEGPVTAEATCDGTSDLYGRATCIVHDLTATSLHAAGFVDVNGTVTLGALTTAPTGGVGVENYGATFTVTGPVRNRGVFGNGTGARNAVARLGGDLHNEGTWTFGETRLLPGPHVLTEAGGAAFEQRFVLEEGAAPVAASDVTFAYDLPLGGNTFDLGSYTLRLDWRPGSPGGYSGGVTGPGTVRSNGGTIRGLHADVGSGGDYLAGLRVEGAVTLAGRLEINDGVVLSGPVEVAGAVFSHYGRSTTLTVDGDLTNRGTIGRDGYMLSLSLGGALGARARADGSPATFRNLGRVEAAGLDVDGASFHRTWVRSVGGLLTRFQNATFGPDVPNNVTQLWVEHEGLQGAAPFQVRHVTFLDLYDRDGYGEGTHDAGKYVYAVDLGGGAPFAVEIVNSTFFGNYVWTDYHYADGEWRPVHGWFVGGPVTWATVEQALLDADIHRVQQINNRHNPDHPAYFGLDVTASVAGGLQVTTHTGPSVENRGVQLLGPTGRPIGPVYNAPASVVLIPDPVDSPLEAVGTPTMNAGEAPPPPGHEAVFVFRTNTELTLAASNVVSAGGANVVSAGGANVVSAGGGNVVSAGGANVVSAGGANVVSAGGANLTAGPAPASARRLPQPDGVSLRVAGGPALPDGALEVFVVHVPVVRLDARVLLAGAVDAASDASPSMRVRLNEAGRLPQTQPYSGAAFSDSPAALPLPTWLPASVFTEHPEVVDFVVVELESASADSSGGFRRAALLLRDGRVVDYDAASPVAFAGVPAGDYVVRIHHRNHLAATSAGPVALTAEASVLDLAASGAATAGSQREVAPGVWAQRGGDVDADGAVTEADLAAFARALGAPGYLAADLDLDGEVTAADAQGVLLPALGRARPEGTPAPGALDARLRYTTDADADVTTVALDLRGGGSLGTSTFRFRYDPAVLELLDGRSLAFVGERLGADGAPAVYASVNGVTAPGEGEVSVNVVLLGAGPGESLPAEYGEATRVRFRTLDAEADPGLTWSAVEAYDGFGGAAGAYVVGVLDVVDGGAAVAGEDRPADGATSLTLTAPYPNPVHGRAAVSFSLPAAGPARLTVYDAMGREVTALVDGDRAAGPQAASLNASSLAPGVYVLRLAADGGVVSHRFTVVR